ncbi:hypothetical protein OH76DRAFT_1412198 [Lentinus brumalis]|uniref:Uncharacterized protein n=1 Tax=Lentinus brumalis TaxID=2498619 RepID=A0A371CM27_9APHY|nr:hypothetical protein OH76DRAFT_1412198 [Polyporus brumalis]
MNEKSTGCCFVSVAKSAMRKFAADDMCWEWTDSKRCSQRLRPTSGRKPMVGEKAKI